jgi:glycosyltransferase involved in cell wall biosynthesis
MPPPWFAAILPAMTSASIVMHLHTGPPTQDRWFEKLACAMILQRASRLIAVSNWIAHEWQRIFPNHIVPVDVVLNGVPMPATMNQIAPEHRRALVFGVAARLEEDKGLSMFLRVAASIARELPGAEFRIAGTGSAEPLLRRLAQDLGISGQVQFTGFVEDIGTFWSGVDVALFTTEREPFGLRLLEPILSGVPVVAFRTGAGSDEVINRCRAITHAEWGDTDTATSLAIRLARDTMLRRKMVLEGISDIARWFTIDRMEIGVRAAYNRAIQKSVSGIAGKLRVDH